MVVEGLRCNTVRWLRKKRTQSLCAHVLPGQSLSARGFKKDVGHLCSSAWYKYETGAPEPLINVQLIHS